MTYMIQKSNFNIQSAQLLNDRNLYCSSVHCAYYSCLQMMFHIYVVKFGKTLEDMERERHNVEKGKHEFIINLFISEIKIKSGDHRTFNNNITQLKMLRVSSDYKEEQILYNKGSQALMVAGSIRTLLKNVFAI